MFYSNINIKAFNKKVIKLNNKNEIDNIFSFIDSFIATKQARGLFTMLPIGIILKNKIETLIRKIMNKNGGIEIITPSLVEKKMYEKSCRIKIFGNDCFSLKNRNNNEFVLAPTLEEIFISMLSNINEKQMPLCFYQNTSKYRDEMRPRNALLRSLEFFMHDLYYFARSEEENKYFYNKMKSIYESIFQTLNINYIISQPKIGKMLEKESHEFLSENDIQETILDNYSEKKYIEIAHIFNLSTIYSDKLGIYYIQKNKKKLIHMSSYGIGISRLIFILAQKLYKEEKGILDMYFIFLPKKSEQNNKILLDIYSKYSNISIYFDMLNEISFFNTFVKYTGMLFIITYYNNEFQIINTINNLILKISNINEIFHFIDKTILNINQDKYY